MDEDEAGLPDVATAASDANDERADGATFDVVNKERAVDVTMELVGASAIPLLVGVTISCDTKTTEVMRTRLEPSIDAVATGGLGTNSVAASKGLLELMDEVVGFDSAKIGLMDDAASL